MVRIAVVKTFSSFLLKATPTIIEDPDYDPYEDALDIYDALHGRGTDHDTIREILSDRVCKQRREIKYAFWYLYDYDIRQRIAEDTGGTYERFLKDLFWCGDDLQADRIKRYQGPPGVTDNRNAKVKNIIEVMVTYSETAQTKNKLKNAYERISYNSIFAKDLDNAFDDDFKHVLMEMCNRSRRPKEPVDQKKAHDVAVALHDERNKWENNRKILDSTLMETPFDQLKAIADEFKIVADGHDLMSVISKKLSGNKKNLYQDLLHFCLSYTNNFVEYFATRLKEAVVGSGTDEQTLIGIILGHSETNMKEIQDQFYASFNEELPGKIGGDTSGGFEHMLKQFLIKTPEQIEEMKQKRKARREIQKKRKQDRGGGLPEGTRIR